MNLLISTLIFSVLFTTQLMAKDVVVLVPGFFNSFTPEYFSDDIVRTFEKKGLKVYVAEGLNPIGTIEDNGARLENIFSKIQSEELASGETNTVFNVVAHSCGGFYTLYVANLGKYKIKNILTISTPFKGIEFVQTWIEDSAIFNLLASLAYLDGVTQLTESGIKKFISDIRISPETRIISFGGYQEKSLDVWNARYLSAPLRVTAHYISEKSDGIVGFSSALANGGILTTNGSKVVHLNDPNYFLPLEHWEQVLDSYSFLLLGIRNRSYIKKEQIRFYSGLADYMVTLL